jgi:predicted HTH transcriptional regulator
MFSDDQIQRMLQSGESQTVEFKSAMRQPGDLARLISAFANTDGGVILVGVEEPARIVGCDRQQMMRLFGDAQSRLQNASSSSMYFHTIEGRDVAVISVPKADRIVASRDGIYLRRGETTVAYPPSEIERRFTGGGAEASLRRLTELVEEMQREISKSNSLSNRLREWLISGIIGAILGAIVSALVGK